MRRAYLVLCLGVLLLSMTGCQKVAQPTVPVETEIVVETPNALKKFAEFSREEFLAMDIEKFAEMVEEALPNYRSRYGIPDGVEMNNEEWEKLRSIMVLEIFGSSYEQPSNGSAPVEAKEFAEYVGLDTEDPNWIYKAPSPDLIKSMSTEEFREYLAGLYAYENPEATNAEEFASTLGSVPEEDIETMKKDFLSLLEETVRN